MLSFVQNFFAPKVNPIGIDFGTDCLRLAQVAPFEKEHKLIAAASADVPAHVRNNAPARLQFFVETTRDLLAQGNFRSREAVLAMPAASVLIQHLRLPKLNDEETRKALPWEARGKLPIDPSKALMRHLIAGEVYQDQEPKNEVILMAAARETVNGFLAAAAKAKLDIVGMNVEPRALIDCFSHIYRRSDCEMTSCFVDIGCASTRAIIARGGEILFARVIPIGGDHFNRASAGAMNVGFEEAKMTRLKLAHASSPQSDPRATSNLAEEPPQANPEDSDSVDQSFALLDASIRKSETATAVAEAPAQTESQIVELAVREPLTKLIGELELCRRYYEATFQNKPVERLIFVGGEARQRGLCLTIAREMGLAAQIGDPLVRMGRISEIGIESGIDRRQPQPGWAVAIGLSMGPARVAANAPAPAKG
jgi:type IV pilus assembly protein PilM